MRIIDKNDEKKLIERKALDDSGIKSLNGFSFQFSNAIFELMLRYDDNIDFIVMFESQDDFLIIDETNISLYQTKNYKGKTYTALNISKEKDKSILGKMKSAKLNISDIDKESIENTLIINNDESKIGIYVLDTMKKAFCMDEYKDKLCLSLASSDDKKKILEVLEDEDLKCFYVRRQLRYKRHVDDTRLFIEDVLNRKYIEPKINLKTVYDFLESRIRLTMQDNRVYSYENICNDIKEIINLQNSEFDNFKDLEYLLENYSTGEINIIRNRYKEFVLKLSSTSLFEVYNDYNKIKTIIDIDKLLEENLLVVNKNDFSYIYDDEELIALVLLVYGVRGK